MHLIDYPSEEYRLLESLKSLMNFRATERYPSGIGDDAVSRMSGSREQLVFSSDISVQNVHFSFEYMDLAEAGYKSMVSNVSDCAAMGAVPDSALIQVVFPGSGDAVRRDLGDLYRGLNRACRRWNFPIVGGDLSIGPCWIIGITIIGRIPVKARSLSRKGAKPGDLLWVSGTPGSSSAGLAALKEWGRERVPKMYKPLVKAHISPEARVNLGLELAKNPNVHALIDISDGISKECHTLSFENHLAVELGIDDSFIPAGMKRLAGELGARWMEWCLFGGEDFELLFAASKRFSPKQLSGRYKLREIGAFVKDRYGVSLKQKDGITIPVKKMSWDHIGMAMA